MTLNRLAFNLSKAALSRAAASLESAVQRRFSSLLSAQPLPGREEKDLIQLKNDIDTKLDEMARRGKELKKGFVPKAAPYLGPAEEDVREVGAVFAQKGSKNRGVGADLYSQYLQIQKLKAKLAGGNVARPQSAGWADSLRRKVDVMIGSRRKVVKCPEKG